MLPRPIGPILRCVVSSVCCLATLTMAVVPEASASTYAVQQCAGSIGAPDAVLEGTAFGYTASSGCGSGSYMQIGSNGAVNNGENKQYVFRAPGGTRMDNVRMDYGFGPTGGGNNEYLFVRRLGQAPAYSWNYGASISSGTYSTSMNGGPVDEVGIGMVCANGNGCARQGGAYMRLSNLTFEMRDTIAPGAPQTSGSALGGWVNGTKTVNFNVSDSGAGVYISGTAVNGTGVDFDGFCSPGTARLKPCPGTGSASSTLNVGSSPFVQGPNALLICVSEYGSNAQSGCKSDTVYVDTIAPTAPSSLAVAGGEGWKRDNSFDLSWTNPRQPGSAPIVGAEVRITGPGGFDQTTYHPGADRSSINNVSVPAKGDYTAAVYLKDSAGNESQANASSVHLRFDNTIPGPQRPDRANGWISRSELASGYEQRWEPVPFGLVPPSGIAGYRVTLNTTSDSDPCSGASDPRACGGALTEVGENSRSRTLRTGDLTEGANYVHVVPVSGSGMRATEVKHTPLKADFTDPVSVLRGGGGGEWINHDANLEAVATDALSGVADTNEYPDDDPPATFLVVDGARGSNVGGSISRSVSGEGSHQVQFWARDLAGNTGQPQSAAVRIDKTAPSVAFRDQQNPDDPDQLVAPASDALSGVVDGQISYRQQGGSEWKALETMVQGGNLVARVDSGDLNPGTTYDFRAIASDKAGNTATSTDKQNGQPMTQVGPFKTLTGVVDLQVNGKARAWVGYKKKATVTGSILTREGSRAVSGASVEIEETFAVGAKKRQTTKSVVTDSQGRFSAKLAAGPSRSIVARYNGDRVYLGASSTPAKLGVRSKVTLKAPKQVDSDEGITFKGKVKAKGAKFGKAGKRLEVQVRVGKEWKAVGKSLRTNEKGAFKLRYRFSARYTRPIRYQFRAVALRERAFPYLPSKSKMRPVTVTP